MGFFPLSRQRLGMTPEEFFSIVQNMPPVQQPSCRLYHDDDGRVMFYSMEDRPGTWIEVDAATYAQARHDVRVISGKIVEIPKIKKINKLRPGDHGTCCDPRDICLITTADQPHVRWSQK